MRKSDLHRGKFACENFALGKDELLRGKITVSVAWGTREDSLATRDELSLARARQREWEFPTVECLLTCFPTTSYSVTLAKHCTIHFPPWFSHETGVSFPYPGSDVHRVWVGDLALRFRKSNTKLDPLRERERALHHFIVLLRWNKVLEWPRLPLGNSRSPSPVLESSRETDC